MEDNPYFAGIFFFDNNFNSVIKNNTVRRCGYGIGLRQSKGVIEENHLENNERGIDLDDCYNSILVRGNVFFNTQRQISSGGINFIS